MREIKFRAWDKINKIMVYAPLIDSKGINNMNGWFNSERAGVMFDFMQYTGLLDKNGKEIYEGDIVIVHHRKRGNHRSEQRTVEWRGAGFNISGSIFADYEVIGNVYENPELLSTQPEDYNDYDHTGIDPNDTDLL